MNKYYIPMIGKYKGQKLKLIRREDMYNQHSCESYGGAGSGRFWYILDDPCKEDGELMYADNELWEAKNG